MGFIIKMGLILNRVSTQLPLQAVCAVIRKLLHAIHGMLKYNQPFDNSRFYTIPVAQN